MHIKRPEQIQNQEYKTKKEAESGHQSINIQWVKQNRRLGAAINSALETHRVSKAMNSGYRDNP